MAGRGMGRSRREYLRSEDNSTFGRKSNALPSRFLWVGNLSHEVNENILAKHFLQFGEVERIALQPGRSFAFLDFKHEEDAFAAMKALQGVLLAGSPLRIEFTKDYKSPNLSLHEDKFRPQFHQEVPSFRGGSFTQTDPRIADQELLPPSESLWVGFPASIQVDEQILRNAFSPYGEIHKITTFPGRTYAFVCFKDISAACRAKEALEGKLFNNPRVVIRFAKSESLPSDAGRSLRNPAFSVGLVENFPQKRSSVEFTKDTYPVHEAKRLRTSLFLEDNELPEYPLSSGSVRSKEWEWEGMIAKGGKLVCRARCFPVGKAMDTMLPTLLNISARTTTEMLSKHYYQALHSWVVFFVPKSDADMESYNEFMQYLDEKQRVAVAKLNENTTLFLVAPSEFSEKVLKVPGRLSISGVILRLEPISEGSSVNYSPAPVIADRPLVSSTPPPAAAPSFRPEQLAQLASSFLTTARSGENAGAYQNLVIPERPQVSPNMPVAAPPQSQLDSSLFGPSSSLVGPQQQVTGGSSSGAEDSDSGKRLQATLQLAAALLQNVQQGKGRS